MAAKKTGGDKTYILDLADGNVRKITVPSHWKMTFGHLVPYANKNNQYTGKHEVALRFYEGSKENLRAVMTDVRAIRDASIQIVERRTTVQRQAAQKSTSKGAKDVIVEARVTEWVNPDSEEDAGTPNEFVKLIESNKLSSE